MSPAQCLKNESLHLQYILWQSQTSIRNVHFFCTFISEKKPPTTKAKTERSRPIIILITSLKSTATTLGRPAQRCVFSSLSRSQKTPWLANRRAPEKTQVKAAKFRAAVITWEFAGLDFVRCLHVPHVDFHNCWKFEISVLDYNQVRTLFERAGSEVNPNFRRSKTHTTLLFFSA